MNYIIFVTILLMANIINVLYSYFYNKKVTKDNVFSSLVSSIISIISFLIIEIFFNLSYIASTAISLLIISIIFILDIYKVFKNKKINSFIFKTYSFNDKFEIIVKYCMVITLIIFIVIAISNSKLFFMSYPLDYDTFNIAKNPYALLFEGLENGHLYLNVKPDESLLALKDPYGYRGNAIYLWDYCFYDKKYFVYFGIAPVILFYFPIYFLTFGNYIPTYIFINYFCLILSIGFSLLALYRFYKHFSEKINIYLFVLCSVVLFFGGGYLLLSLAEPMYNTPLLVATLFMFIMYYYCIIGIEKNSKLAFAIMAFSFVVILASRPNLCFSVFPLLAILFPYLFNKNFIKSLLNLTPCFIVLLIGVLMIGLYNYFRFDSFIDFGANYQLTVSDVSKNDIKFSNLTPSFYYYFFQKPIINDKFPYISIALKDIKNFDLGYYVYTYPTIGLFTIPISYLMFLGLFNYKDKKYIAMNIIFIINIFVLVFLEFSLAGVHLRYLMDILSMCVFISILNILIVGNKILNDRLKSIYFIIILIVVILSLIIFISLISNFAYDYNLLLENFTAFKG